MQLFQRCVFAISQVSAALACMALIGMVGHILYEIVLRTLFATSTFVLDEFVGYGVAACTFLSLGYALEHGNLIRVNILLDRLGGVARRAVETICALLTMMATLCLSWFFWLRIERDWARGTTSSSIAEFPSWIPQAAILAGLLVFTLQLFAYGLRQVFDTPPPVLNAKPATEL